MVSGAEDNDTRDGSEDPSVHLVEGTIVGRRSMGRKLAFAHIALDASCASFKDTLDDGPSVSATGDDERNINVRFSQETFLGPSSGVAPDIPSTLDEGFPTKRTRLPYGARVVVQLSPSKNRRRNPTNMGSSEKKRVCEVLRWKVTEHPRELAERLAALDVHQSQGPQQVTLGSGALSNTIYLKARREAFEKVNHQRRCFDEVKGRETNSVACVDSKSRKKVTPLPAATPPETSEIDVAHGGKHAKALRAKVFASWVLDTFFGIPAMGASMVSNVGDGTMMCQPCSNRAENAQAPLLENAHVLDVAGGKGQLSCELILQQISFLGSSTPLSPPQKEKENGQDITVPPAPISRCTIIDPVVRKGDAKRRHSQMKRALSRAEWLLRQRHPRTPDRRASPPDADVDAGDGRARNANAGESTARGALDGAAIQHLATYFTARNFPRLFSQCVAAADAIPATPVPASPNGAPPPRPRHAAATLLLGLHPDECTEDILDAALEHDLPVAIVPCCVFADLYPTRRMAPREPAAEVVAKKEEGHRTPRDATLVPVRNYEDFLQYLLAKDDRLKMVTLPFEGKNKVIYKK